MILKLLDSSYEVTGIDSSLCACATF